MKITFIFLISLLALIASKDPSTFSNYDQVTQQTIDSNYKIDFDTNTITGKTKISFKAKRDGEVIILDTNKLDILQIVDSDTGFILEKGSDWYLDKDAELDSLGTPLKIYRSYQEKNIFSYVITYKTSKDCEAVQWISKEKTAGKELPYMFTQCQSIFCRQLLPCQDTPDAKVIVNTSITVKNPIFALNSGIYQSKIDNGDTSTYFYSQKIPIPTYLIALAAGAIEGRKISDRTTVYGEAEYVDKAASEFSDTEKFIEIAETYTIPYEWGEYNILVLPPSFPFGGMENPCLTFATPTLLAGDKSLADVIAHEISHSWSGNLVTMDNWSDFWLNEGFTMFLERKLISKLFGDDMGLLSGLVGYQELTQEIYAVGESNDFTSLSPNLVGISPEDAYNRIPYEKGYNLLIHIETLVNNEAKDDYFKIILRNYFNKYKYQSVDFPKFQKFLKEQLISKFGQAKGEDLFNEVDWDNWIKAPGFPIQKNNFTNALSTEGDSYIEKFFNSDLPSNFKSTFNSWHTYLKCYFLRAIFNSPRGSSLTQKQYKVLNEDLGLHTGYNAEVTFNFFTIMLKNNIISDLSKMDEFLGSNGRLRYLTPLYVGLAKINKSKAIEIFNKHKDFYHPIAIVTLENEFKKIN